MSANPFLARLGFAPTDRVVVLHADDIGMSHSSLAAYRELVEFGILSSAATMVPCPWFPATAAWCRQMEGSDRIDMGVHLTLTSEWDQCRWGPVSTGDPASGLLDEEGYFPRQAAEGLPYALTDTIEQELRVQVERALAAGVQVTHLDSHMFVLGHPRLLPIYLRVAQSFGLPAFLPRATREQMVERGHDQETATVMVNLLQQIEEEGLPLFDHVHVLSLEEHEQRLQQMQQVLDELPAGLSNIILHPSLDTPELRALASDWRCRVADHELFTSDALRTALKTSGVQVIGFRVLRDALR